MSARPLANGVCDGRGKEAVMPMAVMLCRVLKRVYREKVVPMYTRNIGRYGVAEKLDARLCADGVRHRARQEDCDCHAATGSSGDAAPAGAADVPDQIRPGVPSNMTGIGCCQSMAAA